MKSKTKLTSTAAFSFLLLLSFVFLFPIYLVIINSFKSKFTIIGEPFSFPNEETFVGLENYINGLAESGLFGAFIRTLIITVGSVIAIVIFTSMTAWFITRIRSKVNKLIYYLFLFSMIVPFQMVMFTMTSISSKLNLNSVLGIIIVYLGFGAGLSVFMFSGFVKSLPREIEEAAVIDGCSPIKTFFFVIFPILKPTAITVAILNAMWIWNDFLLPYLLLGSGNKTLSVAIQLAMQGAYGAIDWGGFMAMLVLSIIPIIIFYLLCQKYIIKGVIDGAVKG
ncbi:MAG: carbohydrate ABC transporter permease [Clostridia bacterium]|nr:carbohydrate ABC transporter permease [Clostridia bacterium]